MNRYQVSDRPAFLLLWLALTCLGWTLVPLGALRVPVYTYEELAQRVVLYGLYGGAIGLLIGVGQTWVLHRLSLRSGTWLWTTLVGYALAFAGGLAIAALVPTVIFSLQGVDFLPLSTPRSIGFLPFPSALMLGGFLIGILQWRALRTFLLQPTRTMMLLWILGTELAVGLGVYGGQRALTMAAEQNVLDMRAVVLQSTVTGAVVGLITGLILLLLLSQATSRAARRSAD
jgi:hypothetical protein